MVGNVTASTGVTAAIRGEVGTTPATQSYASNPNRLQIAPTTESDVEQGASLPQIGFTSPIVKIDAQSKVAVLEFRDSLTGDVLAQIPSKEQLRAYRVREAKENEAIEKETSSRAALAREAQAQGRVEPEKIDPTVITPVDYVKYQAKASIDA